MPTGINVYNNDGDLILDNERVILCAKNNPVSAVLPFTSEIDHRAYYYDAATVASQSIADGVADRLPVADGSEGALWISCIDPSVSFMAFSANMLAMYPYTLSTKKVTYRYVSTYIPSKVTTDLRYCVVYNAGGEVCWSAAALLKSVRIVGFIRILNNALYNKTVMHFDVPDAYPMSDIYVPMFTGFSDEFYNADGGGAISYLYGVMFKFVGQRVYAKLFNNTQALSGPYSTDKVWVGGDRLIPIAYIPAV